MRNLWAFGMISGSGYLSMIWPPEALGASGQQVWNLATPEFVDTSRTAFEAAYRGQRVQHVIKAVDGRWYRAAFVPSHDPDHGAVFLIAMQLPECWDTLSRRERQVVESFAQTNNPAAVARQLGVTMSTVEAHRRSIMIRCDLENHGDFYSFCAVYGQL